MLISIFLNKNNYQLIVKKVINLHNNNAFQKPK